MPYNDVRVYTFGLCHCSVCAPKNLSREAVEDGANLEHPTGLDHGWRIDDAPKFKNGESNPCVCNFDPERLHYLMVC